MTKASVFTLCMILSCMYLVVPEKVKALDWIDSREVQKQIDEKAGEGGVIYIDKTVTLSGELNLKEGTTTIITVPDGEGILLGVDPSIAGTGNLIIKSNVGIHVFGGDSLIINGGANVKIESTSYGMNFPVFNNLLVSNASLTVNSGDVALNIGDDVTFQNADVDLSSKETAINTDLGVMIADSNVKINAIGNGMQAAEKVEISDSILDIATAASGISSSTSTIKSVNSNITMSLSGVGVGLVGESMYDASTIDNTQLNILGGGRGMEAQNLEVTNNSTVNIGSNDSAKVRDLMVADSTMDLTGKTSIRYNEKWSFDSNSRLNNLGLFSNYGELGITGTFYNNGTYRHGGVLNATAKMEKGENALVIIDKTVNAEEKSLLDKLGVSYQTLVEGLDFVSDSSTRSGDGYHWDETLKTLSISNLYLKTNKGETDPSILLPDGAYLEVIKGTNNEVVNENTKGLAIECQGNFTVYGQGQLSLVGNGVALGAGGTLDVIGTTLFHQSGVGLAAADITMTYAKLFGAATAGANLVSNKSIHVKNSNLYITSVDQSFARLSNLKSRSSDNEIVIDGLPSNIKMEQKISEAGIYIVLVDENSEQISEAYIERYQAGHLLRFIANNPTKDVAKMVVRANSVITPPTFVYPGYEIQSWDRVPTVSSPYDFTIGINEDLVLYGKWDKIKPPQPEPDPKPDPKPDPTPVKPTSPDTSDVTNKTYWTSVMLLAGAMLSIVSIRRKRS